MVLPDGVTGSYTCGWCSRCERLWVSIRSTSLQGVHTVNVLGVVKHDALPGGIAQIYITGPPPRKPNPGTSFPRARLYKSPIELQQDLCRPCPVWVLLAGPLLRGAVNRPGSASKLSALLLGFGYRILVAGRE